MANKVRTYWAVYWGPDGRNRAIFRPRDRKAAEEYAKQKGGKVVEFPAIYDRGNLYPVRPDLTRWRS